MNESKRASVEKFLELNSTKEGIAGIATGFVAQWKMAFESSGEKVAEDREAEAKVLKVLEDAFKASLGEVYDRIVEVHDKMIPDEVIDQMIAFRQSPAGKCFVEIGPMLSEAVGDIITGWQQETLKRNEVAISSLLNPPAPPK